MFQNPNYPELKHSDAKFPFHKFGELTKLSQGLTGQIQFDQHGLRTGDKIHSETNIQRQKYTKEINNKNDKKILSTGFQLDVIELKKEGLTKVI